MILEAKLHTENAFLTLTYDDEHVPKNGSVNPRHLQLFMKRLRKKQPFRYFAVGEYGPQTLRPHYHAILFGFPTCMRQQTNLKRDICCDNCERVKKAWGQGAIQLARADDAAIAYTCGYVTKKIEAAPLPPTLHPEFIRMSNRPGIAADCAHDIAAAILGHRFDEEMEDVPLTLQHGRRHMPLGRYLRTKLRLAIGRGPECPDSVLEKAKEELQPLRTLAFENSKSFRQVLLEVNAQKRLNMLSKYKIHSKRKTTV